MPEVPRPTILEIVSAAVVTATMARPVAGAAQRLSQRPDSGATVGGGDVVKMSGGAVVRGTLDRTAAKAWSDFLQSL